jgi:hypothetical protein
LKATEKLHVCFRGNAVNRQSARTSFTVRQ